MRLEEALDRGFHVLKIKLDRFSGYFRTFSVREFLRYVTTTDSDYSLVLATYLGDPKDVEDLDAFTYDAIVKTIFERSSVLSDDEISFLVGEKDRNPYFGALINLLLVARPTFKEILDMPIHDAQLLTALIVIQRNLEQEAAIQQQNGETRVFINKKAMNNDTSRL
ncbi:MAG TPA: hypothetical protein ENJ36_00885 [Candidatus Bathyarchaeota archaeon]|nr:hypothetical protein [Candidatus Bathyarchaeota archaeon]